MGLREPLGPVLVRDRRPTNKEDTVGDGSEQVRTLDGDRRPFLDHLEELRRRLLRSALWIAVAAGVSWNAADWILSRLIEPVGRVVYLSPAEPFLIHLKVAIFSGMLLASPLVAWEAWGFLAPAIYPSQRRRFLFTLPLSIGLFFVGIWFGWKGLLPAALRFFLSFSSTSMVPMLTVGGYVGFAVWLVAASGLLFETPIVVWVLAKLGIVTPAMLLRQWRAALVGILILAAILTPTPDVATQLLLAAPMTVLYFLSACLAFLVKRNDPTT